MDRYSYLNELNLLLLDLPKEEREAALDYFNNYFRNHRDLSEKQILQTIGTPLENANRIKGKFAANGGSFYESGDMESEFVQDSDSNEDKSYHWIWIVISILLFPIWFPIGMSLLMISIFFIVVLSVLILGLGIGTVWLWISSIACIIFGAIKCFSIPAVGITTMGIGLVMLGVAILCQNLCKVLFGKGLPKLFRWLSSLFRQKRTRKRRQQ